MKPIRQHSRKKAKVQMNKKDVMESMDTMIEEMHRLLKQGEWKDKPMAEAMMLLVQARSLLDKEEEK